MKNSKCVLLVHSTTELKVHARLNDNEPMVQSIEIREKFSKRLNSAITNANINRRGAGARLAEITGTTPKAASKWLNEESIPARPNMLKLAKALNVRPDWLEYGTEDTNKINEPAASYSTGQQDDPSRRIQNLPKAKQQKAIKAIKAVLELIE